MAISTQIILFLEMFEIFNYLFICKDQNFVKENIQSSTNYIFEMKNSKIINYSTNIWSCQETIVARYVFTTTSIYDGRLFLCFVLYLWDPRKGDASNHVPGVFGTLSRRRRAWAWCAKVIEYWVISSLKIKLTHSWKFWGTGKCLWCCWKDLDEQDLMELSW